MGHIPPSNNNISLTDEFYKGNYQGLETITTAIALYICPVLSNIQLLAALKAQGLALMAAWVHFGMVWLFSCSQCYA